MTVTAPSLEAPSQATGRAPENGPSLFPRQVVVTACGAKSRRLLQSRIDHAAIDDLAYRSGPTS